MQHLGGEVEVLEALLALHFGHHEGGRIPRRVRGLARLHLLGAHHAAGAHLVRGGVDALRATARTVAPTLLARPALTAARATRFIAPTLAAALRRRRAVGGLPLGTRRRTVLRLPSAAFLLGLLAATATATTTLATTVPALPGPVLLLRGGARPPLLRGRLLLPGDKRRQLLQKTKCHLYSPKTKGRTWKGNPPRRPVVLRRPSRPTDECG